MYNLWKNHAIPILRVSQQSVPEISTDAAFSQVKITQT